MNHLAWKAGVTATAGFALVLAASLGYAATAAEPVVGPGPQPGDAGAAVASDAALDALAARGLDRSTTSVVLVERDSASTYRVLAVDSARGNAVTVTVDDGRAASVVDLGHRAVPASDTEAARVRDLVLQDAKAVAAIDRQLRGAGSTAEPVDLQFIITPFEPGNAPAARNRTELAACSTHRCLRVAAKVRGTETWIDTRALVADLSASKLLRITM